VTVVKTVRLDSGGGGRRKNNLLRKKTKGGRSEKKEMTKRGERKRIGVKKRKRAVLYETSWWGEGKPTGRNPEKEKNVRGVGRTNFEVVEYKARLHTEQEWGASKAQS